MTLPPRLRRWWPLFKRAHRLTTRSAGFVFRCFAPLAGARRLPRSATERSIDTVAGSAGTVTLHPARTGVDLHRPETQGDPADHWVFVEGRTAYTEVPDSFTLDLAEGRLVGDFAATVTRDGVLEVDDDGVDAEIDGLLYTFGPVARHEHRVDEWQHAADRIGTEFHEIAH